MMEAPPKNELQTALQMFETTLETPLIPGELEAWSESVRTACAQAKHQWEHAVQEEHPSQFKQIGREDPEMDSRVQTLKEEDSEISRQFDGVCQDVANFHQRSPTMQEDEGRFRPMLDDLVDKGLKLIIRIRMQEQAIRTWFVEAFDRDRGVAD